MTQKLVQTDKDTLSPSYPPVVSVLGHVDHGKTTLLDAIRKTTIAAKEHGGITQKIGASQVTIMHDGIKRKLTFIDTPGHEAFAKMRGRGAQVADIGLLIISAVDGVMPQTKESIALLKQAEIPFIVVFTKADVADKQIEKIKQQLLQQEVMLEQFGGDVPSIEVSARTNMHIKELLELILLVYDMKYEHNAQKATDSLLGIIIESRLDPKIGPRVSVVMKQGTLRVRDMVMAEGVMGKVRALFLDDGTSVQEVGVGDAVEMLGLEKVPSVGSILTSEQEKKDMPNGKKEDAKEAMDQEAKDGLSVFLAADTKGSLEAIRASLPPKAAILEEKTGEITEADVLFAKSTGAIMLTFNAKIKPEVQKFATYEKVLLKNYTIIYELLEEVKEVLEGKRLALLERILGKARILATFPFEKSQVLGVQILEGRIARGDKIRLIRGEEVVGESSIVSLRQGKNIASKAEGGQEAGILISPFLDFRIGDVILSHS